MNIMTKKGSLDNIVTYEHYCDTKADLANIPQEQISLGSVAIVLKDEGNEMGIYIANSNKEWISFSSGGGGNDMNDISLTNLLDISLINPTDGQTLVYNGELTRWENKNITNSNNTSGDMVFYINATNVQNGTFDIDQDFLEIFSQLNEGKIAVLIVTEGPNITPVPMDFYYKVDIWSEDSSFVNFEKIEIHGTNDNKYLKTKNYQIINSEFGSCVFSENTISL